MTLSVAARTLARVPFALPKQDLAYDLTEIITRPRSGVLFTVGEQTRGESPRGSYARP